MFNLEVSCYSTFGWQWYNQSSWWVQKFPLELTYSAPSVKSSCFPEFSQVYSIFQLCNQFLRNKCWLFGPNAFLRTFHLFWLTRSFSRCLSVNTESHTWYLTAVLISLPSYFVGHFGQLTASKATFGTGQYQPWIPQSPWDSPLQSIASEARDLGARDTSIQPWCRTESIIAFYGYFMPSTSQGWDALSVCSISCAYNVHGSR